MLGFAVSALAKNFVHMEHKVDGKTSKCAQFQHRLCELIDENLYYMAVVAKNSATVTYCPSHLCRPSQTDTYIFIQFVAVTDMSEARYFVSRTRPPRAGVPKRLETNTNGRSGRHPRDRSTLSGDGSLKTKRRYRLTFHFAACRCNS